MQELFANRYRRQVAADVPARDDRAAHASGVDVLWRAPQRTASYRTPAISLPRELAIVLRRSTRLFSGAVLTLAITCTFLALWALSVARHEAWGPLAVPLGLLSSFAWSVLRRVAWAFTRTTVVVADGRVRASDTPLPLGRARALVAHRIVAFACWRSGDGTIDLVARLRDGSDTRLVCRIPSLAQAQTMKRALEEAARAGG